MRAAPIVARSSSAEETRAIGRALAAVLRAGDVVLLEGDLGSGKTTLTQGLAAGLGVSEAVTSPTFTLVRAYECVGAGAGIRTLLHADLYRLERLREVAELGLGELVEDEGVAVVEWGDMAGSLFGPEVLRVRLAEGSSDDERIVQVVSEGSWVARADTLGEALGAWKG